LKNEKQKREPIPIIETGSTKRGFKTKHKRKRIFRSVSLFKTKSESETDALPTHSKYINKVLNRKVSYETTFGVYQFDTNGSFQIGRSSFK